MKDVKQHYIPQCYLRMFSDDDKYLWVYDKVNHKTYKARISDLCTKNNFYTLSDCYIEQNPDLHSLSLEKDVFAKTFEPLFAESLTKINDKAKKAIQERTKKLCLNKEDKQRFANLLTVQWFRHPLEKENTVNMFNEIDDKMIRLFKEGLAKEMNRPEIKELEIQVSISDSAAFHASNTYLNNELVNLFTQELSENIWTFKYSSKGHFYTSDFPITVIPHGQYARPKCQGLTQYGAELTFPISKNLVITIWDREFFADNQGEDLSITSISDSEVRKLNEIRYIYAQRQLFCKEEDLEFIALIDNVCPITMSPFANK